MFLFGLLSFFFISGDCDIVGPGRFTGFRMTELIACVFHERIFVFIFFWGVVVATPL